MLLKFINSVKTHKNAELAAFDFKEKYGSEKLKIILSRFNELGIIPVPIAVKEKISGWDFTS